jgi:hypothetical protein
LKGLERQRDERKQELDREVEGEVDAEKEKNNKEFIRKNELELSSLPPISTHDCSDGEVQTDSMPVSSENLPSNSESVEFENLESSPETIKELQVLLSQSSVQYPLRVSQYVKHHKSET